MRKNLSFALRSVYIVISCLLVRMIRRSTGVGQSEKHMSRVFAENY